MQRRFKSIEQEDPADGGDDDWLESLSSWKERRRKSLHSSLPRLELVEELRLADERREAEAAKAEARVKNRPLKQRMKERAKSVGQMGSSRERPVDASSDSADDAVSDLDDPRDRVQDAAAAEDDEVWRLSPPPPPPPTSARERLFINGLDDEISSPSRKPPPLSSLSKSRSSDELDTAGRREVEEVVVALRPKLDGGGTSLFQLGLRLASGGGTGSGGGVRVDYVAVGGQADLCGLRVGDVLLAVEDRPTAAASTVATVRTDIERGLAGKRIVRLRVRRLVSDDAVASVGAGDLSAQQKIPQQQQPARRSEFRPLASSHFGPPAFQTALKPPPPPPPQQQQPPPQQAASSAILSSATSRKAEVAQPKHVPLRAVNNPSMFSAEQTHLMRKSLPENAAKDPFRNITNGSELLSSGAAGVNTSRLHQPFQQPPPLQQPQQQQQQQQQDLPSGGSLKILQNRALMEQHQEQRNNRILRRQQLKVRSRSAERREEDDSMGQLRRRSPSPPQPQPLTQPPPPPQEVPVVVKDSRVRVAAQLPQPHRNHHLGGHRWPPQPQPPPPPPPLPPRGVAGDVAIGGGVGGSRAANGVGVGGGVRERAPPVSSRQLCSHCGAELGSGAAMAIESLSLYYHVKCFRCCVCDTRLGNGTIGADVRVRRNKLHCTRCFSSDEGVKFSCV